MASSVKSMNTDTMFFGKNDSFLYAWTLFVTFVGNRVTPCITQVLSYEAEQYLRYCKIYIYLIFQHQLLSTSIIGTVANTGKSLKKIKAVLLKQNKALITFMLKEIWLYYFVAGLVSLYYAKQHGQQYLSTRPKISQTFLPFHYLTV